MDDEARARAFALRAHGAQRYGDEPYEVHLQAVRQVLRDFGHHGDLGVAAWLHDVVEDTPVGRETIEAEFGPEIAALVWAVTGVGPDRKSRCQAAYQKMQALPRAVILKLADRIANSEASARSSPRRHAMYQAELPGFRQALGAHGDPAMWQRLERVLAQGG